MKNSKNKIIASVICGMVIGSVGTSIVGNFQAKSSITSASVDKSSNSTSSDNNYPNSNEQHQEWDKTKPEDGRGNKGKGGHHQGAASLDSIESVDVASGSYTDGTYEGTADGYAQNLKVAVKVSGGKIESVDVTSHNETPGFYEKAFEKVPAEIVSSQSTNVDTASGATYSSVGIINAVNNALSSASK